MNCLKITMTGEARAPANFTNSRTNQIAVCVVTGKAGVMHFVVGRINCCSCRCVTTGTLDKRTDFHAVVNGRCRIYMDRVPCRSMAG